MNNKLFNGLVKKLDVLLEDHTAIFFKERPWLENPPKKDNTTHYKMEDNKAVVDNTPVPVVKLKLIPHDEERRQNELETQKVIKAINKLVNPAVQVAATQQEIEDIFSS